MLLWGIIGLDDNAGAFARALGESDEASLGAAYDADAQNRQTFTHPELITPSEDDIFSGDIDAVFVNTTGTSDLQKALRAHKCVIAKMPVNTKDLDAMITLARDNLLVFTPAVPFRKMRLFQVLLNDIRRGVIGDVTKVTCTLASEDDLKTKIMHVIAALQTFASESESLTALKKTDKATAFTFQSGNVTLTGSCALSEDTPASLVIEGTRGSVEIPDWLCPRTAQVHLDADGESYSVRDECDEPQWHGLLQAVHEAMAYLRSDAEGLTMDDLRMMCHMYDALTKPRVIGLTGGIATGKSTVTSYLLEHGYTVLDADQFAHEAYDDKDVLAAIEDRFGTSDRKALGAIVFADEAARRDLEAIIHPYVKVRTLDGIENAQTRLVFLDVPLLFESGFDQLCDTIVCVTCDPDIQLQRLMARNGLSEDEARKRVAAQMPLFEKAAKSDYVISNNDDIISLTTKVQEVLEDLEHDL